MKGYYIEVTNNLLDPKHRKAMGEAVWLFMWFLDCMTSVNEQGVGKVLGGKPIKSAEVMGDLGISERTYFRWAKTLEQHGYINVVRAPYGLIVSVNKAKKSFKRVAKAGNTRPATNGNTENERVARCGNTELPDVATPTDKNGNSDGRNGNSNKDNNSMTYTVDNNSKTLRGENAARESEGEENKKTTATDGAILNKIMEGFMRVNPNIGRLYANTSQRKALDRLIATHGVEKVERIIAFLPVSNRYPFAPTITTPLQLELKWGDLMAWGAKEKAKQESKGKKIIA